MNLIIMFYIYNNEKNNIHSNIITVIKAERKLVS